jgi:ligand-binding SRPBCC domain-containing protein
VPPRAKPRSPHLRPRYDRTLTTSRFHCELTLPLARADVFDFFSRAGNLERITPPWLRFRTLTPSPIELKEGAEIAYALRLHGLPLRWLTRIEEWDPPRRFVDLQVRGPYRLWRHTHTFEETAGGTSMFDDVEYALPLGPLGRLFLPFVERDIRRIFDYRTRAVQAALIGT